MSQFLFIWCAGRRLCEWLVVWRWRLTVMRPPLMLLCWLLRMWLSAANSWASLHCTSNCGPLEATGNQCYFVLSLCLSSVQISQTLFRTCTYRNIVSWKKVYNQTWRLTHWLIKKQIRTILHLSSWNSATAKFCASMTFNIFQLEIFYGSQHFSQVPFAGTQNFWLVGLHSWVGDLLSADSELMERTGFELSSWLWGCSSWLSFVTWVAKCGWSCLQVNGRKLILIMELETDIGSEVLLTWFDVTHPSLTTVSVKVAIITDFTP